MAKNSVKKTVSSKNSASKKAVSKKTVKKTVKKTAPKKVAVKKATAKKKGAAKSAPKKIAAKKSALKKVVAKKAAPKKGVSKKAAPKKKAAKKKASKKLSAALMARTKASLAKKDIKKISEVKTEAGIDLTEKFKELVLLAQEQGYLTHEDVTESLPEQEVTPADVEAVHDKLQGLEISVVDQAEVDDVYGDFGIVTILEQLVHAIDGHGAGFIFRITFRRQAQGIGVISPDPKQAMTGAHGVGAAQGLGDVDGRALAQRHGGAFGDLNGLAVSI